MANTVAPGLALSYVNRVDGRVHLRLHLPAFAFATGAVPRVRAVKGGANRVAEAAVSRAAKGVYLEVTFTGKPMTTGAWAIEVSPRKGGVYAATGSRIVIADGNPITFLIGFDPSVQAPAPIVPKTVHTLPTKKKLYNSDVHVS